jgi:hypothetical protein
VKGDDAFAALDKQMTDSLALLRTIPENKAEHRYATGKWSIKETVGHVIDGERVFAYRALRFARTDETPLPGFDENVYVPAGKFDRRTLVDLVQEWELLRKANMHFFRGLDADAWSRGGKANDAFVTVRALAWIIAGHGMHHTELLRTRYLA